MTSDYIIFQKTESISLKKDNGNSFKSHGSIDPQMTAAANRQGTVQLAKGQDRGSQLARSFTSRCLFRAPKSILLCAHSNASTV